MNKIKQAARFLWRLPIYWRMDQSDIAMNHRGLGSAGVQLGEQAYIRLPDHARASSIFRRMAFERANVRELREFIALSKGCANFVDIGASGGFFSAVFAAINAERQVEILSIEIDPPSVAVLEQMRERNAGADHRWHIDKRAISNSKGETEIASIGYGAQIDDEKNAVELAADREKIARDHTNYTVASDTLEAICKNNEVQPDLLKVDIEGFEMEMLEGSWDFIAQSRPRIALELHVDKIRARGKRPEWLLEQLETMGYRLFDSGRKASEMMQLDSRIGCIRAGLWSPSSTQ